MAHAAHVQARCSVRVGHDIAVPLVDLGTATRTAKARVYSLRAQPSVRQAKAAIVEKHGSRQLRDGGAPRGARAPARALAATPLAQQQTLEFLNHAHAQEIRPSAENLPALLARLFTWRKKWKRCGTRWNNRSDRCRSERKRSGTTHGVAGEGAV